MTAGFDTRHVTAVPVETTPEGADVRALCQLPGAGSCTHVSLPPGHTGRAVVQGGVQQIWYVLGGAGEMWRRLDGTEETVLLMPGVCLTIPVGTAFQFRAAPVGGRLEIVAVSMPPDGDSVTHPADGPWLPDLSTEDAED